MPPVELPPPADAADPDVVPDSPDLKRRGSQYNTEQAVSTRSTQSCITPRARRTVFCHPGGTHARGCKQCQTRAARMLGAKRRASASDRGAATSMRAAATRRRQVYGMLWAQAGLRSRAQDRGGGSYTRARTFDVLFAPLDPWDGTLTSWGRLLPDWMRWRLPMSTLRAQLVLAVSNKAHARPAKISARGLTHAMCKVRV